jgi:2-pyrone-4,6-dicarboxylate lactonase
MTPSSAYLAFDPAPHSPRERLPAGTCDSHFHVFEDVATHPLAEVRSYTPTPAPWAAYRQMAEALGIERSVLVHPSVYGADHASYEAALLAHPQVLRGVCVASVDHTEEELARWHRLGTRGTRCNLLFAGGVLADSLPRLHAMVKPFGWHLQLLIDIDVNGALLKPLAALGWPLVIDHLGHFDPGRAAQSSGWRDLLALVREGRAWVKLSGAYRLSRDRSRFEDLRPLVDALVQANPDQLVWGSDWPHPAISAPMHNDGRLADLLFDWLSPDLRHKVLVDNPTRLYWAAP